MGHDLVIGVEQSSQSWATVDMMLASKKVIGPNSALTLNLPAAATSSHSDDISPDMAAALLQLISQHASEGQATSSDSQARQPFAQSTSQPAASSPLPQAPGQLEPDTNTSTDAQYPRDQDLRFTTESCREGGQDHRSDS
ncbi:hypothetical protein P4O66_019215 [Electrophorus voltai]|uniref:Uncharacterized protein n=1 Tax=Electrophorus voltai TaxID=2609070 RepID=A0AAD8ZUP6_9TELE|nr:hypothetical protein P4O66_019215 [Electrophorus voltai]